MNYTLVFFGGGLGAMLRHAVNVLCATYVGTSYPWGTLFINVSGSMLRGVVVELASLKAGMPPPFRLFLATGVLGGYTTFSTFSLESALLHTLAAVAYALASMVFGVGCPFARDERGQVLIEVSQNDA